MPVIRPAILAAIEAGCAAGEVPSADEHGNGSDFEALAARIDHALFTGHFDVAPLARAWHRHVPDTPTAVETLTHLLEVTRRQRDKAQREVVHWQAAEREERRKKRHVSGLLSEALSARRALEAEVPRALYKTRLGEVMGRGVGVDDVPLIAQLLPIWPEGTDTTR